MEPCRRWAHVGNCTRVGVPSRALDRAPAWKLSADGTLGTVHLRHSLYVMMVVMRFTATTMIINPCLQFRAHRLPSYKRPVFILDFLVAAVGTI